MRNRTVLTDIIAIVRSPNSPSEKKTDITAILGDYRERYKGMREITTFQLVDAPSFDLRQKRLFKKFTDKARLYDRVEIVFKSLYGRQNVLAKDENIGRELDALAKKFHFSSHISDFDAYMNIRERFEVALYGKRGVPSVLLKNDYELPLVIEARKVSFTLSDDIKALVPKNISRKDLLYADVVFNYLAAIESQLGKDLFAGGRKYELPPKKKPSKRRIGHKKR